MKLPCLKRSGSGEEILTLDVSSKQKKVKFFPDLPRVLNSQLRQQEIDARKKWWLDKKKTSDAAELSVQTLELGP